MRGKSGELWDLASVFTGYDLDPATVLVLERAFCFCPVIPSYLEAPLYQLQERSPPLREKRFGGHGDADNDPLAAQQAKVFGCFRIDLNLEEAFGNLGSVWIIHCRLHGSACGKAERCRGQSLVTRFDHPLE